LRLGIEQAMSHGLDEFKEFVKTNTSNFTAQTYTRVLEITKMRKFTGRLGCGMHGGGSRGASSSSANAEVRAVKKAAKHAEKERLRAYKKEIQTAHKIYKKIGRADKRLDQLLNRAEKRKAQEQEQRKKQKKNEQWQRYKWYMSKDRTMAEILEMRKREEELSLLAESEQNHNTFVVDSK